MTKVLIFAASSHSIQFVYCKKWFRSLLVGIVLLHLISNFSSLSSVLVFYRQQYPAVTEDCFSLVWQ